MKVELQIPWLRDENFSQANPLATTIADVVQAGKEILLQLKTSHGLAQMSVWGTNLNKLIGNYGNDTDAWVGKPCIILQVEEEGKKKRTIQF